MSAGMFEAVGNILFHLAEAFPWYQTLKCGKRSSSLIRSVSE